MNVDGNHTEQSELSHKEALPTGPIENCGQDRLKRQGFAEKLATAIARRQRRESFVVGLQGPWGSGKSSIKNMMIEALGASDCPPLIVDFAPWQLRDADALFSAFFNEISIAIGKNDGSNDDLKERFQLYGNRLALGSTTLKALGLIGGLAGVPLSNLVEKAGEKLGDAAKVASQGADAVEIKSLKELKDELKESLRNLASPLLVIIDDIDRLEVEEMMLIFQLVKANADFPNFTYLLLFQRDVVEAAIIDKIGDAGKSYLEKIIQLPIDIPKISESQLHKLFREEFEEICTSWQIPTTAEQLNELDSLWRCGLNGMLLYPRDVLRLLSSLEFTAALMQGDGEWEVNVADFCALEAMRILEPTVYHQLPLLQPLLTRPKPTLSSASWREAITSQQSTQHERSNDLYDQIMGSLQNNLSIRRRESARSLLAFVFPQAKWAFLDEKVTEFQRSEDRVISGPRACIPRCFRRYFALSIPDDEISETEIKAIINQIGDAEALKTTLQKHSQSIKLWTLLDEIHDRIKEIPSEYYISLLKALIDLGDEKSLEIESLGLPAQIKSRHIVNSMFMLYQKVEKRGRLLTEAIQESSGLLWPAIWITKEQNENSKNDQRVDKWVTDEQCAELVKMLTQRIKDAALNGHLTFWGNEINFLADFWSRSDLESLKQWLNNKISDEIGLRWFITHFHVKEYIINDPPIVQNIIFHQELFNWLDNVETIKERVENLDTFNWDEYDKIAVEEFVKHAEHFLTTKEK